MASNDKSSKLKVADRKTWAIKPKDLIIMWGEERNYWRIDEGDGPAELLQVCWLEVRGSAKEVTKGSTYEIRFKLSKKDDAFGWENAPVFIMAKIGDDSEDKLSEEIDLSKLGKEPDETTATFKIQFDSDQKLDPNSDKKTKDPSCDKETKSDQKTADPNRDKKTKDSNSDKKTKDPSCDKKTKSDRKTADPNRDKKTKDSSSDKKTKSDQKTEDPNSDTLHFGLYEVWANNWKGGLIIHEAIVEEITPDHASASTSKH